jgi:hypothetical protein
MSKEETHHPVATVPVYHWYGARPFPLVLGEGDTGAAQWLLLNREGDACLVPISWQANVPAAPWTRLGFHADALDEEALRLTLADLGADGWVVVGRLDIRFSGRFADDAFWADTLATLWQPPAADSASPASALFPPDC